MYTTITASSRFKIYAAVALAALLMTLLAVTLTAGQAQATASTIVPSGDDNSIPQQQGQAATPTPEPHKTPEACPGETGNTNDKAASVVDSGYYALFDVWWNDDEGELTNNVCPPKVKFVPAGEGEEGEPIPARVERSPSSIDITAEPPTIIHIPSSAKVTLSESNYPKDKYGDVWHADDAENPNGDGDRMVWVLPACPDSPTTDGLCISYSAALLNQADWVGDIKFIVTHVHQVDIDKQDRRYVLAYDVSATGPALRWYSANQEKDTVDVAPGEYDRTMWFFPSRGAYEFQMYIRGNANTTLSNDGSVTSDFRKYILHVSAEADLSATVDVTPQSPSPGDNVTIEITASNAGPDAAPETKVEVSLPEGLTYSSHDAPTGTSYNSTTGDWTWNEDISFASDASKTLTITATVDAETHGETLAARATISATETVTTNSGDYDVPVLDPTPGNNTATGTTTVASSANVAPMFVVTRSVPENSSPGVLLGGPIAVREPDGDTLTFSLTGEGADQFTASSVSGGAQIAVAGGADLDYETAPSYDLALGVSDGKDDAGNADSSTDHTIVVEIEVTNDPRDDVTLTMTYSPDSPGTDTLVTWTAHLHNLPENSGDVRYTWKERSLYSDGSGWSGWDTLLHTGSSFVQSTGSSPGTIQMSVEASFGPQWDNRTIGPTVTQVSWQ